MIIHSASRPRRLGIPGLPHADPLAGALDRRLDDGHHWFRSIAAGGGEPIDAILVGPGGTWAVTLASDRGRFARRNGHWYRWNRGTESWVPWDGAVVAQARLAGHRLSLQLERAALPAEVGAMLVTPSAMEVEIAASENVHVRIAADADALVRLAGDDEHLTPQQVDRIVAFLDPRQPVGQLVQATPRG